MKDNPTMTINSKKSNTLVNMILTCIVFLIFIVSFEVVLRHTHLFGARISWSEPDHVLEWRHTPSSYYWFFNSGENDHPITGYINKYGWRDKNWTLKKEPNTYRIAVIGDSYVEALQVESERTFLSLSEKALNDNNIKVELMNFGRSGFTQTEELIILKEQVINFSPDMVMLFFLPSNDIKTVRWKTSRETRPYYHVTDEGKLILDTSFSETRSYKIRSLINPIKKHSALVSLIAEKYIAYQKAKQNNRNDIRQKKVTDSHNAHENKKQKKTSSAEQNQINGFLSLATSKPDGEYLISYDLNKLLIKEMADYCRERGIRFMLVTNDNVEAYTPALEQKYKSIDPTFNASFFDDDMYEFATALDIDYLGLNRIFMESYITNGKLLHWGHWNYNGHALVADVLAKRLKEIIFSDHQKEMIK